MQSVTVPIDTLEVAERSYREVLAATVHQDDKVGRIITAAAFLTTGALTIITRTAAPSIRLDLLGVGVPVVAIAIGVYFACTTFAVIALVLSLSTPHVHLSSLRDSDESLLFFNEIGKKSRTQWLEMWKGESELNARLESNYKVESLNLARRVLSKYRRTFIAVRVFELGIFYLAVGGLAYLFGFASTTVSNGSPHPIEPDYLVRSVFLATLVVYLCLMLLAVREQATYDRSDWSEMTPEFRFRRGATMRLAGRVLVCLVLFEVVILMVPISFTHWIPLFLVAGCLVMLPRFRRSIPKGVDGKSGGAWIKTCRFELSYLWLYNTLSFLVMTSTLAMGAVIALIPTVASVEARLAAAAAVPVFMLVAALVRQNFSARRIVLGVFGAPPDNGQNSEDPIAPGPTAPSPREETAEGTATSMAGLPSQ